jgi:hypothetical protein
MITYKRAAEASVTWSELRLFIAVGSKPKKTIGAFQQSDCISKSIGLEEKYSFNLMCHKLKAEFQY